MCTRTCDEGPGMTQQRWLLPPCPWTDKGRQPDNRGRV